MPIKNHFIPLCRLLLTFAIISIVVACDYDKNCGEADRLNDKAYHYHYISLDSTTVYANKALDASTDYDAGHNEAMNNLAFVDIMKMNYRQAEKKLKDILSHTDNQIEQLVANTQMMRLCQRESRNKEFYDYYWNATRNLKRIDEDKQLLSERQTLRVNYAESEIKIVTSTYLYYVGQVHKSAKVLSELREDDVLQKDTAQLLNYFYNVGSGEYFLKGSDMERSRKEFDYLMRCYLMAQHGNYVFWQANALQALSEHMQNESLRESLIEENPVAMKILELESIDHEHIAIELAHRSLCDFISYGDTYQIAGALRTLSDCLFLNGKYVFAIECLNEALTRDTLINQSPSIKSSLYEKLSINYSALNEKQNSDYNRNLYLDTQENIRQDRELEARAEQVDKVSLQLNLAIGGVIGSILMLVVLLIIFSRKRKNKEKSYSSEILLKPLTEWRTQQARNTEIAERQRQEIIEEQASEEYILEQNLNRNIEQRAKMSLVNSITPFIDRMLAEIHSLENRKEDEATKARRYGYIAELSNKINEYNDVLTNWIQLRKGELSLHIESFRLQELFDIVKGGSQAFKMKNVTLEVLDTDAVVRADKTLTLFMINTIADNARKASHDGGKVSIYAVNTDSYVELSIEDNGDGMDEEQLQSIFNRQPSLTKSQHGFGLMNCKGIIEKYKKVSRLFAVCSISAESEKGNGSTFRFRLPYGKLRSLLCLLMFTMSALFSTNANAKEIPDINNKIRMYADSVYFCNLQGKYQKALDYSVTTCHYLNERYRQLTHNDKDTLKLLGISSTNAAELRWFVDSIPMRYDIILDLRNEAAVAALALHKWDIYNYNNGIFTLLYKECSADHSLERYVKQTQTARDAKNVALIILSLLFICIIPAYYMLYYRYVVYYRQMVDKVNKINSILFESIDDKEKKRKIENIWTKSKDRQSKKTRQTSALDTVVKEICIALEKNIKQQESDAVNMELANDELKRLRYEAQRLYIHNSVLDNCFSALKHETMYYPSRIKQIVENQPVDIEALREITSFYKDLYTILSAQAQAQITTNLKVNEYLTGYLQNLLLKLADGTMPIATRQAVDKTYDCYTLKYENLHLDESQASDLFTPMTQNLTCLLIRQIVREIGESTGKRGCGIQSKVEADGNSYINIIMYNKIILNFQ